MNKEIKTPETETPSKTKITVEALVYPENTSFLRENLATATPEDEPDIEVCLNWQGNGILIMQEGRETLLLSPQSLVEAFADV